METQTEKLQEEAITVINSYLINKFCEQDGHVMEHVTNLLFEAGKFNSQIAFELTNTCKELLALLTDPAISIKLPQHMRLSIGQTLLKMQHFFENIDDPACLKAYELYEVKYHSPKETRLKELINRYNNQE